MNLFKENIRLAMDLARRDLSSKYRRSILGLLWLMLTPLCLLGIYSFVFGVVFGVKWKMPAIESTQGVGYALPFFIGLAVYLTLSDVVNSSTVLFASKRTYVVKSPFPLWVLWLANLIRSAAHACVLVVLVMILALFEHRLTFVGLGWALLSLVVVTLFITSLSLLLASLGPFIGDISEAVRLLLRVLFYATPITYPLAMVPIEFRGYLWFNPLTCMVEPLRNAIVFGQSPEMLPYILFLCSAIFLCCLAAWIFKRVKGVISDVV